MKWSITNINQIAGWKTYTTIFRKFVAQIGINGKFVAHIMRSTNPL